MTSFIFVVIITLWSYNNYNSTELFYILVEYTKDTFL